MEFLKKNSDSVRVLFLGSSHAYYGINPEYCCSKSYNSSHISQTLDYDFEILNKFKSNWASLKCIAIPISYFSLYLKLEDGIECWRVKNYTLYYKILTSKKIIDCSEVLGCKLELNLEKLYNAYILGKSNVNCSALGWGVNYNSKNKKDLIQSGITASQRHRKININRFEENVETIEKIVEFAADLGIDVFFYTPPAYHTYTDNLDREQLKQTINTMILIDYQYTNVHYYNFLTDGQFKDFDFYDADHLNEIGARKLTERLDSMITEVN